MARVVVCSDSHGRGGTGVLTRDLMRALSHRGHTVQGVRPDGDPAALPGLCPDVVVGQHGGVAMARGLASLAGALLVQVVCPPEQFNPSQARPDLVAFAYAMQRASSLEVLGATPCVALCEGFGGLCDAVDALLAARPPRPAVAPPVPRSVAAPAPRPVAAPAARPPRAPDPPRSIQPVAAPRAAEDPAVEVTVVVPAFNAGAYVEAALRSVLAQAGLAFEVLVVDDASDDATGARARAVAAEDPRVRVLTRSRRGGAAGAKNTGLAAATGAFITFFDADDVMLPGALAPRVAALRATPDAAAAYGRLEGLIDASGVPLESGYMHAVRGTDARGRGNGGFTREELVRGGCIAGYTSLVYRRAALEGLAFDESLPAAEDFEFAYRALARGRALFVDVAVLLYRIHGTNTSVRLTRGEEVLSRPITNASHARALRKHGL